MRWFGSSAAPDAAFTPTSEGVGAAMDTPCVPRDRDVYSEGDFGVSKVRRNKIRADGAARGSRVGAAGAGTRVHCAGGSAAGVPEEGRPLSRPGSSSVHSCASAPASMGAALVIGVAMEEGRGRIPAGFTTPVAEAEGARGGGGGGFPTPANGDGYTPDNEDGPESPDAFTTPDREGGVRTPAREDGFTTPV